jgi:hypothetical protein
VPGAGAASWLSVWRVGAIHAGVDDFGEDELNGGGGRHRLEKLPDEELRSTALSISRLSTLQLEGNVLYIALYFGPASVIVSDRRRLL